MQTNSIWLDPKLKTSYEKLNKDIEVDVLIIGGGITGISTLYHLKNSKLKICLVEKNNILSGVTGKTTGKITYLQDSIYTKLINYHGLEKTKLYLESQKDAIKIIENIIKKENIDCNLEQVRSYVFTNKINNSIFKDKNILKDLNINIKESNILPNNEKVLKSYYVDDTYVFHPIKYLKELIKKCENENISIYENTKITSIKKKQNYFKCKTNNNIIKAKKVIIATHYPYFFKKIFLPIKSYIEKSYIEAYKVKTNYKFSSINVDKETVSNRYYNNNETTYKIFLTNSHNTSKKDNYKKNFKKLLKHNNNLEYIWSNKDIITIDMLPYIGSLNDDNNLLIATGYNTWGMTNGTLAGKILSDIILNNENKYIELFKVNRCVNVGTIINLPKILFSNSYSFIKSRIYKRKKWYSENVIFKKINGKNVAIYIDKNGKKHIVYNKCPHLKCGLLFNAIEKTWDCPCHGSRFDIDGKCIEGPSNYDISYKD